MLDSNEMSETCERLKAYPNLVEKVKEMLDLIERQKVVGVDNFEEALIPQVRKFGQEVVQTWASSEEQLERESLEGKKVAHHSKKNSTGKLHLEE